MSLLLWFSVADAVLGSSPVFAQTVWKRMDRNSNVFTVSTLGRFVRANGKHKFLSRTLFSITKVQIPVSNQLGNGECIKLLSHICNLSMLDHEVKMDPSFASCSLRGRHSLLITSDYFITILKKKQTEVFSTGMLETES